MLHFYVDYYIGVYVHSVKVIHEMDKKYKLEVFNMNTGKWEDKMVTIAELKELVEAEDHQLEKIQAEFEITQKSIAMQLGMKEDPKSKD